MFAKIITFFAGFFQEDKPESFARGITFVIVSNVLCWDIAYIKFTHTLPDVSTMLGQIGFMTAFYGVNKWAANSAKSPTDKPPTT